MLPQYAEDGGPARRGPWRVRPPDEEWRDRAACRGKPVDWWVPSMGAQSFDRLNSPDVDTREFHTADAVATCDACPVRSDCLEYALAHPELEGYWGGASQTERARIRFRRLRERTAG